MNKDTITTVLGGTMAALTAAQPVINGVQGQFHQQDYVSLLMAVVMAVFGFFTNKKEG